jgi:xylulokinase
VGGQARSEVWNQIKADVLNRPVLVPSVIEAAVLGAAILAALGIGAYASLEEAIAAMVRVSRRLEPDARNAALYARMLEGYRELYPALRQTNWRLHDIATRSSHPTELSDLSIGAGGTGSTSPPGSGGSTSPSEPALAP